MGDATTTRDEVLGRLPERIRDAWDNPEELERIAGDLSDEELDELRRVIDDLSELLEGRAGRPPEALERLKLDLSKAQLLVVARPGVAREPDSVADEPALEALDEVGPLPEEGFRLEGAMGIPASPRELELAHRSDAPEAQRFLYPVYFATTRRPRQEDDPSRGFRGDRDPQGRVHHGVARVSVPESHTFGSIGSAWWKRWAWTWTDDRLKLRRIEPKDGDAFFAEVGQVLADFRGQTDADREGQILVYVHGYNVGFTGAVVRAAQIGCDLRVPGLTACFSWASRGTFLGYPADEESVGVSVPALADFLARLADRAGAGRVHLLAHSMGNRAALRALERLVGEAKERRIRLGQILLAAPDVDAEAFRQAAPTVTAATQLQANLYVSEKDWAVGSSRWVHTYPRAGRRPPTTVAPGVATIDVGPIDRDPLGHGYFAAARPVLEDISKVIHANLAPAARSLVARDEAGAAYWAFY